MAARRAALEPGHGGHRGHPAAAAPGQPAAAASTCRQRAGRLRHPACLLLRGHQRLPVHLQPAAGAAARWLEGARRPRRRADVAGSCAARAAVRPDHPARVPGGASCSAGAASSGPSRTPSSASCWARACGLVGGQDPPGRAAPDRPRLARRASGAGDLAHARPSCPCSTGCIRADQRHGLDVVAALRADGHDAPDLLLAGLFHDASKGPRPDSGIGSRGRSASGTAAGSGAPAGRCPASSAPSTGSARPRRATPRCSPSRPAAPRSTAELIRHQSAPVTRSPGSGSGSRTRRPERVPTEPPHCRDARRRRTRDAALRCRRTPVRVTDDPRPDGRARQTRIRRAARAAAVAHRAAPAGHPVGAPRRAGGLVPGGARGHGGRHHLPHISAFVAVASQLILIKSRALLPRPPSRPRRPIRRHGRPRGGAAPAAHRVPALPRRRAPAVERLPAPPQLFHREPGAAAAAGTAGVTPGADPAAGPRRRWPTALQASVRLRAAGTPPPR